MQSRSLSLFELPFEFTNTSPEMERIRSKVLTIDTARLKHFLSSHPHNYSIAIFTQPPYRSGPRNKKKWKRKGGRGGTHTNTSVSIATVELLPTSREKKRSREVGLGCGGWNGMVLCTCCFGDS
ncbi:hypothetical protein JTE90_019040 [Oedothorax gibbosus]|uniref:Uncharacterized protein n=1 Tax=Oedothorax gibbosus TaxID=931172 RepID=A0AAV6UY28_9ARAC|nr:hypothetical protein JTE90_019040 [Oedothorax gibbosus]